MTTSPVARTIALLQHEEARLRSHLSAALEEMDHAENAGSPYQIDRCRRRLEQLQQELASVQAGLVEAEAE